MYRQLFRLSVIFILIFFLHPSFVSGQEEVKYDISVAGISIGEMTAVKRKAGQKTSYEVRSEVSFWFFGRINVDYLVETEFHGKQLISSDSQSKTNRGDFRTLIQWDKDHYKVDSKNYKYENTSPIHKPLHFSSSVFFFEEPVNISEFMADGFGLVSPIQKVKDYYEVDVNGNKNKYYYVNGVLEKIVMYSPIKNYVVKRK
ncbi:DUF6134 family protein [Aquiflexum sp.]|uniref:DUF6134 family protein n=1 Tax=Aquiflexum sp. TaxID=1872584 RepID=UPI0035941FD4